MINPMMTIHPEKLNDSDKSMIFHSPTPEKNEGHLLPIRINMKLNMIIIMSIHTRPSQYLINNRL